MNMIKVVIVSAQKEGSTPLVDWKAAVLLGVEVIASINFDQLADYFSDEKQLPILLVDLRCQTIETLLKILNVKKQGYHFRPLFLADKESSIEKALCFLELDYLRYPPQDELFLKKLQEVKTKENDTEGVFEYEYLEKILKTDKIALNTQEGYIFVRQKEIIRWQGEGAYSRIFLANGQCIIVTKTLKYYDQMLQNSCFFRVHRSHLVNLNYVRQFIKGRTGHIVTTDGEQIEVSPTKRVALLDMLSNLEA